MALNYSTDWFNIVLALDNGKVHPRCGTTQKACSLGIKRKRSFAAAAAADYDDDDDAFCLPGHRQFLSLEVSVLCHPTMKSAKNKTETYTNYELK